MTAHQLIMLKPMQTGLSGYARFQTERGRALVQINLRGIACGGIRAFWYAAGGLVRELGTAPVNPRSEAALTAELPWDQYAPDRLQALLLVEDGPAPRPLMIGLCARQSAGSLLDAKNASLSLCERIKRENSRQAPLPPDEPESPLSRQYGSAPTQGLAAPDGAQAGETAHVPRVQGKTEAGGATHVPRVQGGADPGGAAPVPRQPDWPQPNGIPPGEVPPGMTAPVQPGVAQSQAARPIPSRSPQAGSPRRPALPLEADRKASSGAFLLSPADIPVFSPPREIFLPAIDPAPYIPAREGLPSSGPAPFSPAASPASPKAPPVREGAAVSETAPIPLKPVSTLEGAIPPAKGKASPPSSRDVPVGRLGSLCWPKAFQGLQAYFDRLPPCRVLALPGWRFVCVSRQEDGLWIGFWQRDGLVRKVAYAMAGEPRSDDGRPYQRVRGVDGRLYRVLFQRTDATSAERSPASTRPGP